MQQLPVTAAPLRLRHLARDLGLALLVAALLTAARAWGDWAQVGRLVLPDTDDAMRLAQVRDLLAGQRWNDWTQYRLGGPAGAPMHWSRLGDIGPALLILLARPVLGGHAAEIAAAVAYPGLLFAGFLFGAARIARRIWDAEAAPVAIVLAALAYPANAQFVPGRIDHHGLQILCVLGAVLALTRAPTAASGAAAGAAIALGLGVGLETVPQLAALIALLGLWWVADGARERDRMAGFAAGLGGVTLLLLAAARPSLWSADYCDAFTPASATATLAGAGLIAALAIGERMLGDWRARLVAGAAGGGIVLGGTIWAYPACVGGPYGRMDPFLRRAIIDNVTEATGLLEQASVPGALAVGGLVAAGTIAGVWMLWRAPGCKLARRLPVAVALGASFGVTLAQARGAYVGAALAAPVLAGLVLAARRRTTARLPALLGAWACSTGVLYLAVPPLLSSAEPSGATAVASCRGAGAYAALDRLPRGVVLAPLDLGAYLLAGTRHPVVAASYHRNNGGNRAAYAFFLSAPPRARAIAARTGAAYVLWCPGAFDELDLARRYPNSLAAGLRAGDAPGWLATLPLRDTGLRLYRVR